MVCGRNETSKAICTLEMNYLKLHPCKRLHAKTFTRRNELPAVTKLLYRLDARSSWLGS